MLSQARRLGTPALPGATVARDAPPVPRRLLAVLLGVLACALLAATIAFNVANGDITVFSALFAGPALLAGGTALELWDR